MVYRHDLVVQQQHKPCNISNSVCTTLY